MTNPPTNQMKHDFRLLVIDLLDSADGIPEATYVKLVWFADTYFNNVCDDIWPETDGADGSNGYCIFLDEDTANKLRNKE